MKVTTTYLQMFARPERVVPPPREGLSVAHAGEPTVAYSRPLYDAVGRDYDWTGLEMLPDAALDALLHDPRLEVHVLVAEGVPAGFAELDRRAEGEIELVQFGLVPEFIGRGLGRYFLGWAIDRAGGYGPERFWLPICTKDHPAALRKIAGCESIFRHSALPTPFPDANATGRDADEAVAAPGHEGWVMREWRRFQGVIRD